MKTMTTSIEAIKYIKARYNRDKESLPSAFNQVLRMLAMGLNQQLKSDESFYNHKMLKIVHPNPKIKADHQIAKTKHLESYIRKIEYLHIDCTKQFPNAPPLTNIETTMGYFFQCLNAHKYTAALKTQIGTLLLLEKYKFFP